MVLCPGGMRKARETRSDALRVVGSGVVAVEVRAEVQVVSRTAILGLLIPIIHIERRIDLDSGCDVGLLWRL